MAFDTYANLQLEILAKLNRAGDTDAVARCVSWITLAENEIRASLNRLMARQGETRDPAFSIAAEYTALPAGFYRGRQILLTSVNPRVILDYVPPSVADSWDMYASANTPRLWTIQGGQLRVFPTPNTTYTATFTYWALPSLSGSQTSNWLLAAHPKLYFKAALCEAYDYYDDAENKQSAIADREMLLDKINLADSSDQQGTRLKVRVNGATP